MDYQIARDVQFHRRALVHQRACGMTLFFLILILLVTALPTLILFPSLSRASGTAVGGVAGDAARGKVLFEKRCTGCHSLDQDKEGPHLRNAYGSKAGSVPAFKYSSALKSAQVTWNEALLDKWLTDPDSLIPDNDMDFHVPNPEERADIIRFLRLVSGKE